MKRIFKFIAITSMAIFLNTNASFAGEGHERDDHKEESHDEHNDHDSHEDDGHGGDHDDQGHDEHGHGDEHQDEMKTEIDDEAALNSGVIISTVKSGVISDETYLTGRIILNKNTTSNIGARFSGIVKKVSANWGDEVKKGQVVATIESNESLRSYEVRSPISGVILERYVSVGDVVEGGSLFIVADISNIWAKFHIFPKDVSKIVKGDVIAIKNISDGKIIESKIKLIFPTADELSQTIIAIAEIDNKEGSWKPGMVVEGIVKNNTKQALAIVKNSAIQNMEGKDVVFIKKGNSYEAVEISKGRTNSKYTEIISGLDLGQEYVEEGSFIIKADIQKSAAAHDH